MLKEAEKPPIETRITRSINLTTKLMLEMGLSRKGVSDGYHTFSELYKHRITNFVVLCRFINKLHTAGIMMKVKVWKSKLHSDGSMFEGNFILGITGTDDLQITYHLGMDWWDQVFCEELPKAPEFDGHTPADVLDRLMKL